MPLLLVLVAVSASPAVGSSWKVSIQHNLDLKMTMVIAGKKVSQSGKHTFATSGKLKVDSVTGDHPDAVSMTPAKLGALTVKDDSGVGVVRFEKTPEDPEIAPTVTGYLGRLVQTDPDRAAMSACGEGHQAAAEHWLKKTLAAVFHGQADDLTLSQVKLACAVTKSGIKDDVSFDAALPRGVQSLTLKGKGSIEVDNAVWVTTWKLSGPMEQPGDPAVDMKLSGTFTSKFELGR